MPTKKTTPHHPVNRIVTGYFQEQIGYSAFRTQGTADWLLIYTIRGSGEFGLAADGSGKSGGKVVSTCGEAMLLRPGTLHDYSVYAPARRWDLLWAHFHPRPEWVALMDWPEAQANHRGLVRFATNDQTVRKTIEQSLFKMHRLAVSAHRLRDLMAMNALEEALLWCASQDERTAVAKDARVSEAQEYLCQHLRENVTLDELADVVGLSVSRLSHVFRHQTGLTPQRYYELQRLERARQLLELTAMPIKQISSEVGFASPFYFTLRFKRHTGKSPKKYRNG